MSGCIRWTEEQLKAHQKRADMAKNRTYQGDKSENRTKVHAMTKTALQGNTEQIKNIEDLLILDCEISATPPSVNHYWVKSGRGFKLSDKARDFHDVIALFVPQLNTVKRLKLEVIFHFPNRVRRDIDNHLKATIDSLVKCGLCVDDEQFDELIVKRGQIVKGGLIKLKVWEF